MSNLDELIMDGNPLLPGLEFDIPQYQVASYLGITPTQLSRIRAKK